MRQYLIRRLRPESPRDQLKLALPSAVLCVLITRVRKPDGLTRRFMRWGYRCPKLFLLSLFNTFSYLFCLDLKLFCSSTGFLWMSWLGISNPQAAINDNGMRWWISISSWCDVSIFASGSISEYTWRSCEGSASSPFLPSRVFSLSFLLLSHLFHTISRFFYMLTGVRPPSCAAPPQMRVSCKGASYVRITCMTWSVISHHVARSINAPHIMWEKLHPACHKFKSAVTI